MAPATCPRPDLAVIGAGVVGLASAWRAAAAGMSVVVHERAASTGNGASGAAAGMLAPVAEADPQEPALLAVNRASADRWPQFASELLDASGVDCGLRSCGTLLVARDDDEAAHLDREHELQQRLGLPSERLLGSATRRLEPALTPSVRRGVTIESERALEPARLVAALEAACVAAGVAFEFGSHVDDLALVDGGRVLVATGAWSGEFGPPVRPVKGQALRLRDPDGPGLVDRVLRWGVPIPGYLVPRGDGRYYLGATAEERGFDTSVTALALHDLLRDAAEIVPGLLELEVEQTFAGLRPGSPDNMPLIGPDPSDERVVWATGHYRNGILLTPLTGEIVLAHLGAGPVPEGLEIDGFAPGRFTAA